MALQATNSQDSTSAFSSDRGDRFADHLYEPDTGRSNFAAFLLGGVVIAGGMLAFLYYDTDNLNRRDDLTTGSIAPMTAPGPSTVPSIKIPMRPADRDAGAHPGAAPDAAIDPRVIPIRARRAAPGDNSPVDPPSRARRVSPYRGPGHRIHPGGLRPRFLTYALRITQHATRATARPPGPTARGW